MIGERRSARMPHNAYLPQECGCKAKAAWSLRPTSMSVNVRALLVDLVLNASDRSTSGDGRTWHLHGYSTRAIRHQWQIVNGAVRVNPRNEYLCGRQSEPRPLNGSRCDVVGSVWSLNGVRAQQQITSSPQIYIRHGWALPVWVPNLVKVARPSVLPLQSAYIEQKPRGVPVCPPRGTRLVNYSRVADLSNPKLADFSCNGMTNIPPAGAVIVRAPDPDPSPGATSPIASA